MSPVLARQYAQHAVDNASAGKIVGTMGKVMTKLKSLRGNPDSQQGGSGTS